MDHYKKACALLERAEEVVAAPRNDYKNTLIRLAELHLQIWRDIELAKQYRNRWPYGSVVSHGSGSGAYGGHIQDEELPFGSYPKP